MKTEANIRQWRESLERKLHEQIEARLYGLATQTQAKINTLDWVLRNYGDL